MCLITIKTEPKVAEKDIVVYKLGQKAGKMFLPVFQQDFGYEQNTLQHTKFSFIPESIYWEWLFSCKKSADRARKKYNKKSKMSFVNAQFICVAAGFHSFKVKKTLKEDLTFRTIKPVVGRFTIPKGSLYYEEGAELVSNQIIFNKFVK